MIDDTTYFIPNRSLPPECGPKYQFRCPDILVTSEGCLQDDGRDSEINIIFVPLESGMVILSQILINTTEITNGEWHTFVVDSPDCSPTVIYKVPGNGTFTVCVNFTLQYIAVHKIQLHCNKQIIDGVVFEGPLTQLSITNLSTSNLSNFVLEVSSQVHKVYFAVDNAIFVMDVQVNAIQTRKNIQIFLDADRFINLHL